MPGELFCGDCGARNEADASFCETCGHPIQGDAPAAPAAAAPVIVAVRRRRLPVWLVVLLVLVGGAAIARVVFPLQTGLLILSIEEKLHLGPFRGERLATGADSTGKPVVDAAPQPIPIPEPAGTLAPPPAARAVAPAPQVASASDSIVGSRNPRPSSIPTPPPGASSVTVTRNEVPQSTPVAPPSAPVRAPDPPPAVPAGRIAAGSVVVLKAADKVCTDKNKEGDQFRATVDRDVSGFNGGRIPKGAAVTFVIDHLKRSTNKNESTVFSVTPSSLQLNGVNYPLSGSVDSVAVKKSGHGLVGALIGAAAGVAATKAAGGNMGAAVAGGVVGGVAGGVVGSHLGNSDGCIDKNAYLRITLRSDVTLTGP